MESMNTMNADLQQQSNKVNLIIDSAKLVSYDLRASKYYALSNFAVFLQYMYIASYVVTDLHIQLCSYCI